MFHGSMVALVTPFTSDGQIDWLALANLVEFHIEQGTDAIIAVGTTGEAALLSDDEKCRVIAKVTDIANERIAVIAGTAANSTQKSIALTQKAMECGVDAALIMTPAYIKPTQLGLIEHYKAISQAVALPIILYNVPSRTACDMLPETVKACAKFSNIIGIKEATGLPERTQALVECCEGALDVYSGDDLNNLALYQAGAKGTISVTANVAPKLMSEFCLAAKAQDWETAKRLHAKLSPLHEALFVEPNPIPVKWALAKLGLINEQTRLPLTPLSKEHHKRLSTVLDELILA